MVQNPLPLNIFNLLKDSNHLLFICESIDQQSLCSGRATLTGSSIVEIHAMIENNQME